MSEDETPSCRNKPSHLARFEIPVALLNFQKMFSGVSETVMEFNANLKQQGLLIPRIDFSLFREKPDALKEIAASLSGSLDAVAKEFGAIAQSWEATLNSFAKSEKFADWRELARLIGTYARMRELGCLPHQPLPIKLMENHADDATHRKQIEEHYRQHWPELCEVLRSRIRSLALGEETKAVFEEALQAHQAGFYRVTCRALIAEIERTARVELLLGVIGHGRDVYNKIQEAAEQAVASYEAAIYCECLGEQLYAKVTKSNEAQILASPIPNRHAALHGYTSYNTFQNSLNAIFLAAYTLRVVAGAKEEALS